MKLFFSQMPDVLGVCGTLYKVKKEDKLLLGGDMASSAEC